jgi:acetyl esterase/lipase
MVFDFFNQTITSNSPCAISPENGIDLEFDLFQKSLPKPTLVQSETECLNLNITLPNGSSQPGGFPVVVYIHGGGFAIGSNAWPQYNFRRIVQLSLDVLQPIIAINLK